MGGMETGGALLQGAAQTQLGLTNNQANNDLAREDSVRKAVSEAMQTFLSQQGANKREKMGNDASAAQTDKTLAAQKEIENSKLFVTLTPDIIKGAKSVTGDKSWDEIKPGTQMRADVYSGLLAHGVEMNKIQKPSVVKMSEGDQEYDAEYTPGAEGKPGTLKKLQSQGGDKFDKNKGQRTPEQNMNALSRQVSTDEKNLLKHITVNGVPDPSLIKKLILGGDGLNDQERAQSILLRQGTDRYRANLAKLNEFEDQTGSPRTEIDPDLENLLTQVPETKSSTKPAAKAPAEEMVEVTNPKGTRVNIKKSDLDSALKQGYKK